MGYNPGSTRSGTHNQKLSKVGYWVKLGIDSRLILAYARLRAYCPS
jgi:hypothetical protein